MPSTTARSPLSRAIAPNPKRNFLALAAARPQTARRHPLLILIGILLLSALPHQAHADNTGLVGYWSFDEGTGTQATDFSGNGNTGTTTNMANPPTATSGWTTNGKHGKALNFDGIDDYVNINPVASSIQTGSVTMPAWFKLASTFSAGNPNMDIVGLVDAPSTNDVKIRFQGDTGKLSFQTIDSTSTDNFLDSTATSWAGGVWHHVVVVIDTSGGGGKKLYIDGVLNNSNLSVP